MLGFGFPTGSALKSKAFVHGLKRRSPSLIVKILVVQSFRKRSQASARAHLGNGGDELEAAVAEAVIPVHEPVEQAARRERPLVRKVKHHAVVGHPGHLHR